MKVNILFIPFLLLLILFSVNSFADSGDKEWNLHKETNGIQIYYKYVDCIIPAEGFYQEQVLLKFVNTTQTPLKIKWQLEAWYEGKCFSCSKDEYTFELEIPSGETIVGDCDINTPSKLKIFSKFLNSKHEVKLEKFNIAVLEVTPYMTLPVASFNASPISGCQPLIVNFNNTTPFSTSYFWQFGDNSVDTTSNPSHTYNKSGSYTVTLTVTDVNGRSSQFTNNNMITVHPLPVADFSTNNDVGAPNVNITFNSGCTTSTGTWYWDFGDGAKETWQIPTALHAYTTTNSYVVKHIVESQFGCKDTVVKTILVSRINIPNIFTPNGDGLNDYFVIDGINQMKDTHLVVFNRQGKKVFESADYKNDWNGNNAPDGVYYFILTFKDNILKIKDEKFTNTTNGTVTILR